MLPNSLTHQLAQMALENQYDRPALCWDLTSPDQAATDLPPDTTDYEQASIFLLDEEDVQQAAQQEWASAEYELQQTKSVYTFHLLIARLVFRNDPTANGALQLAGQREESLAGWTAQAMNFYDDLGRLAPAMINYGITLPELRQAKAMVEAVVACYLS